MAGNAYLLRKSEVEYELKIRGVSSDGTANELRKKLSQCFSSRTEVNQEVLEALDTEAELEECEEKFDDLSSLVEDYDGNKKDNEFKRISARLRHLYHRIERLSELDTEDSEEQERTTSLLKKTKTLLDSFSAKEVEKPTEQPPPMDPPNLAGTSTEDREEKPTVQTNLVNNYDSSTSSEVQPKSKPTVNADSKRTPREASNQQEAVKCHQQDSYYRGKFIPVYKWGLKFDIESGQSVGSFLERVEELRRARGLTHQELFESAVDLFTGTALIWYRSAVGRVSSWQQLCRELKLVFQSPDYDDMLRQEISNRVQGPEESIDLFLAAVEGLYGRLSAKIPESERLHQVLKNLNPYLLEKLCMFDIGSLETLRDLGRKAELGRLRSSAHTQPQRHHRVLEPDLAWGTTTRRKTTHQLAALKPSTSRPSESTSTTKCWNCSSLGHRFSQCTQERVVFCFGCGTPGVKKASCQTCKSKNGKTREPAS